ncbi:WD40-repeat-containing domain protein [Gloeopeniophorella convolvens]|nr:WD40-repeat-containing domain protein [Gloeopeniophorella convolvens]
MPPKSSSGKFAVSAKTKERPAKKAKNENEAPVKSGKKKYASAPPQASAVPSSAKGKNKEEPVSAKTQARGPTKSVDTGATTESEKEASLPSSFKVISGSYERLLYGLQGTASPASPGSSELEWSLKPIFIFPAHVSYIKAIAASPQGGKWLATGSGDEIIKVWDLRRRKEVGGLMHHEGSITHLVFPSRSHLMSASEDGTLCLFRARDWAVLRSLKGHKGRVNSIAVHPSGKVALSVGKDRTLRMWDLMRGRRGASMKLGYEGELVRWSTTGSLLIVQHQKTVQVYSTDLALLHALEHPSRIHDVKFVQRAEGIHEVLLVAAEDKKVTAYDISPDTDVPLRVIAHFVGHSNRVKALDTIRISLPSTSRRSTVILSTVSSDGTLNVYDLSSLPLPTSLEANDIPQISPVVTYDSKGSRFTCITLAGGDTDHPDSPEHTTGDKRKREAEADEDEDHSDEWLSEQENEAEEEEEEEEE